MLIFDGHSDLWEDVDEKRSRGLEAIICSIHRPRWQQGNISGGIYPIWVDPFGTIPTAVQAEHIIKNMLAEYQDAAAVVSFVRNFAEYEEARRTGKQGIFLGAEGLSFIGTDVDRLDDLYHLGMRAISLTWNEENALATGALGDPSRGLTLAGKMCVKRIQALSMLLDLAHANRKTFWDILKVSEGPCIVSHGNCRHICDHPRNYDDAQIKAVASRKGVIGISAYPPFISERKRQWTVGGYVDHIAYVSDLAGVDHVGLGFDLVDFLDDVGNDPSISYTLCGFSHIGETAKICEEMSRRGFTEEEQRKICHDNFMRVIKDVLK